jgi:nicotinamide-nucleotide amidase
MAEVIQKLMIYSNVSLSTAESCTGGNIAHLITSISGSSNYFLGGVVCYSAKIKIDVLDVNESTINQFGVVSEQTVVEMAEGAKSKFKSDYSIAVSGIAGPDGGTEELPVGSIWIAVCGPKGSESKLFRFSTNRGRNITMASQSALNMLRKMLLKDAVV